MADKHTLPGGATRSERAPQFHLNPGFGHRRTSKRFDLGAEKHGEWNWLRSMEHPETAFAFCKEAYNHMQEHMLKMVNASDPTDDHLGAIGWAVEALAFAEQKFGCKWTEIMAGK